jgi:hypothetical protein
VEALNMNERRREDKAAMMKQRIAQLSDPALAAEVKRFGLIDHELSDEDKAYGDALMQECKRRLAERRVWLGPGIVMIAGDGIYDGPQVDLD